MLNIHLKYLACSKCCSDFRLEVIDGDDICTKEGTLLCLKCGASYSITNSIPRFVDADNYANSFGFEWLAHKKTQYDHASGVKVSEERFAKETRWGGRKPPRRTINY